MRWTRLRCDARPGFLEPYGLPFLAGEAAAWYISDGTPLQTRIDVKISNGIGLHYYFNDDSHDIDAAIRNSCESALLTVINEVARELGVEVDVQTILPSEGGFRDKWDILGKNNAQLQALAAVAVICGTIMTLMPSRVDSLREKSLELDIELKKKQLEQIQKSLSDSDVSPSKVQTAINSLEKNYKVVKQKSNFYKNLSSYPKVSKLGLETLDSSRNPLIPEKIINRKDFPKFILKSDKLPTIIDEQALIEIISPVISEGDYKWKGRYQGEVIPFEMRDEDFKQSVLNRDITFQNGALIECVLHTFRKLDEAGEVKNDGYAVYTVIEKDDEGVKLQTQQGKKYHTQKKEKDSQSDMFNG